MLSLYTYLSRCTKVTIDEDTKIPHRADRMNHGACECDRAARQLGLPTSWCAPHHLMGGSRSLKMAPFDRSHMTFNWSAIVNIALSGTVSVFELFDVEWYHDLEIWVRGHSRSFKLVPFKSLGTVSYSPCIVTMALYWVSYEIKPDIGRKSWFFIPLAFNAPLRESPSEYCHPIWYGKTRNGGAQATRWWKNFWGYV